MCLSSEVIVYYKQLSQNIKLRKNVFLCRKRISKTLYGIRHCELCLRNVRETRCDMSFRNISSMCYSFNKHTSWNTIIDTQYSINAFRNSRTDAIMMNQRFAVNKQLIWSNVIIVYSSSRLSLSSNTLAVSAKRFLSSIINRFSKL